MRKLNDIVMYACNQGGHFSQILALNKLFGEFDSVLVTDNKRATTLMPQLGSMKAIEIIEGESERRKQQGEKDSGGRFSYLDVYVKSFFTCLKIWSRYRPKVIISTGSNIAVPLFVIGKMRGSKIVFIETRAKVYSRSMTGILVRHICDQIYVQWPEMLKQYPKAKYCGTLV